jgi:urea transporter
MILMPDPPHASSSLGVSLRCGLPRAFSILFFSASERFGWALLLLSLLAPDVGLVGVAGAASAGGLAWQLGFDRAQIRSGYLLFNPLLACLTLGYLRHAYLFPPLLFLALGIAVVVGSLFLAVALQHFLAHHLALSAQSLPAVGAAWLLTLAVSALAHPTLPPGPIHASPLFDLLFLPPWCQSVLQSFGAMVFVPRAAAGALVLLALAVTSPLTAFYAATAVAAGFAAMALLGLSLAPGDGFPFGFNFIMCGIALGAAYFVPSRTSLLLALFGAFLCALLVPALTLCLRTFGLTAGVLPYNLAVLLLVYALRLRREPGAPVANPRPGAPPENLAPLVALNAARFPHLHLPALELPLKEECIVTQGFNDSLTHRGPWAWALDFEIPPVAGRENAQPMRLEDFPTYHRRVLAPCPGTVVSLRADVPDNPPGANNPEDNWGNYLLLKSDAGYHVLLAHLRPGSTLVNLGQRVATGEIVARCGNSGRSPVPHLHLHVQDSPVLGAPTRPFCLRHVVEPARPCVYRTSVLPPRGRRLESPALLPELRALFCDWLPGHYRYRVLRRSAPETEESLALDFDEGGRFRLRSSAARLSAFLSHHVFYAVDYDGPARSLLALVAAGLARVPCVANPALEWEDQVDPSLFASPLSRSCRRLAAPFFSPRLLTYRYALHAGRSGYEIRARLIAPDRSPSAAPLEITTLLRSRACIESISATWRDGATLRADLIAPTDPHAADLASPSHSFHARASE